MPATRAFLALLVCGSLALAAEPAKLRTLAGKQVDGELVSVSDKEIVLQGAAGPVATPVQEVLDVDLGGTPAPPAGNYSAVELADGTQLFGTDFSLKGKEVRLKLPAGTELTLPLATVATFLRDANDTQARADWQAILGRKGARDVVAVRDKAGKLNGLDGTFGDGDAEGEAIAFETATGARTNIKLERVQAMKFVRRPDPEAPEPLCKVYDVHRNVLVAKTVAAAAGGAVSVTTVTGAKVEVQRDLLARLDYSKGKLTYLSDVEPVRVNQTFGEDRIGAYRRDKNADGDALRLGDKTYAKGLSLLPYTELVYDIGGNYKEFKAVLGPGTTSGPGRPVRVRVEADGKEIFAAEVKPTDPPLPVARDVKDVRQLRIVVTPVNLLDLDAGVQFADARVSK